MTVDDVRTLRTEALRSTEPGRSGAAWIGVSPIPGVSATQVQQALEQLAASVPPADETQEGKTRQATQAQIEAGTAGNLFATVARLKAELDRRATKIAEYTYSSTRNVLDTTWVSLLMDQNVNGDPEGWRGQANGVASSSFTLPPGLYSIYLHFAWAVNSTGQRITRLFLNGVTEYGPDRKQAVSASEATETWELRLTESTKVAAQVLQTSGVTLSSTGHRIIIVKHST